MTSFRLNGSEVTVDGDHEHLLTALRDELGVLSPKDGCAPSGQCGCCTVLVDGRRAKSCTIFAVQADGSEVTTIEGLAPSGDHPVQRSWAAHNVPQCGYCQSGQIMSAVALLSENPNPSDAEIESFMAGNICRCGMYGRIKAAIKTAAANTPAPIIEDSSE